MVSTYSNGEPFLLAHPVCDHDERLVHTAEVERARCVGQVVGHLDEFPFPLAVQMLANARELSVPRENLLILSLSHPGFLVVVTVRLVVEAMGDDVDVAELEIGRLETISNGVDRESARCLLTSKAFLGRCCANALGCYQRSGGVEPLTNAILLSRQIWI